MKPAAKRKSLQDSGVTQCGYFCKQADNIHPQNIHAVYINLHVAFRRFKQYKSKFTQIYTLHSYRLIIIIQSLYFTYVLLPLIMVFFFALDQALVQF